MVLRFFAGLCVTFCFCAPAFCFQEEDPFADYNGTEYDPVDQYGNPGEGPGVCLTAGPEHVCGHFFTKPEGVPCSGSCSSTEPCSPSKALVNDPNWDTKIRYKAKPTRTGRNGNLGHYVPRRCTVEISCVCTYDPEMEVSSCKAATTGFTTLNSYSTSHNAFQGANCVGDFVE